MIFKIGDKVRSIWNHDLVGIIDNVNISYINTIDVHLNSGDTMYQVSMENWELYFEIGDIVVHKSSGKTYRIYSTCVYHSDNNGYKLERINNDGIRCTRINVSSDEIRLANDEEKVEFLMLEKTYETSEKLKEKLKPSLDAIDALSYCNHYRPIKTSYPGHGEELSKFSKELMEFKKLKKKKETNNMPKFKQVIYNDPATIIFWEDGTKTVVKCEGEKYDELKGLMIGIVKKVYGLKNFYTDYDIMTKYVTGKNTLLNIEKGLAERYVMSIYHIKKINSKDDIYKVAMTDGFYVSTERK